MKIWSGLSLSVLLTLFSISSGFSQKIIPLYKGKVPNSYPGKGKETAETDSLARVRVSGVTNPTLEIYLPPAQKANGAAVIICPGGGYTRLAYTHEGTDVAKAFNQFGTAAFVLKYRLPADSLQPDKSIAPIQDAQQAIKLVRQMAADWHIDTHKVGILGFSAGGHLASTAVTHFDTSFIENSEHINLRPDFGILVYPVISFSDSLAHKGSRINLIGANPSAQQVRFFSSELQVKASTPPIFIIHAADDRTVKVQNTLSFYAALLANHVPGQLLVYPYGGHGFGLINKTTTDSWITHVAAWMKAEKMGN
jgi:acetyl esterase/lipase